jgi:hypothetical protein
MNLLQSGRSLGRMPKRILLALAMAALALAACNSNNLITAPSPSPTTSPTLAPGASTAPVFVTIDGSPVPGIPVSVSTPDSTGRPGTPFVTQTTGPNGGTVFSNLTAAKNYCFVAVYQNNPTQFFSLCTIFWSLVQLGT